MEEQAETKGVSGVRGLAASAIVAAITFAAVDLVWLGFIARDLYLEQVGHLVRQGCNTFDYI